MSNTRTAKLGDTVLVEFPNRVRLSDDVYIYWDEFGRPTDHAGKLIFSADTKAFVLNTSAKVAEYNETGWFSDLAEDIKFSAPKIPAGVELNRGGFGRFDIEKRRHIMVDIPIIMEVLLEYAGSRKALCDMYWRHRLPLEAERLVECEVKPETLIGYKPSDYR